jgi:hypothetical protein
MQCLFGQRVKLLGSSLARACHLAFLNQMHEFDAAQQNACTPECLEAELDGLQGFSLCPHHPVWNRNDAYDQERTDENGAWNLSICCRAILLPDDVSIPSNVVHDRQYGLIATEPL